MRVYSANWPRRMYQPLMPAITKDVVRKAAVTMWARRKGNEGLKTTSHQLVTKNRPSRISNPAGVCSQLLDDRIQKDEMTVPSATISAAKKCMPRGTRLRPNSMMPRNAASRKKAVTTSYWISGPSTLPVRSDQRLQLVPNWYDMTMPDTTPMPNDIAKILVQNSDRSR